MPKKNKNQQELPLSGMDNAADTSTTKINLKVSPKQEKFCQLMAEPTAVQWKAYKEAFNSKSNPNACGVEANKLLKHPNISLRIAEIRRAAQNASVMNVNDCLVKLSEWGRLPLLGADGRLRPFVAKEIGSQQLKAIELIMRNAGALGQDFISPDTKVAFIQIMRADVKRKTTVQEGKDD